MNPFEDKNNMDDNYFNYQSFSHTPDMDYKPYKAPKQKRKYSAVVVVVASALAAIIGAVSALAVTFTVNSDSVDINTTEQKNEISNVSINVDETAASIAEAVALKCTDSVVGIRTTVSVASFFGGSSESTGEGSGVIYTDDGYIITNYHVISDAISAGNNSKIEVFVSDKNSQSYEAAVVGYNISADLAVLKIDAENLQAVQLGSVDDLKVGQYVVTIGAPGGLEFMGSVTYGIISGLDRVVSADSDLKLIQTDAAINPGNSGGALLDAEGRLIGINSSKIVAEEFEGMGFAIPVDTVKEKCDKIIARENSPEPYIGISVSERYTAQALAFYGYPAGAVVSSVAEGSPAENAGIARGDIITEFGGTAISEYNVLDELLHDSEPGQKVTVKLYRSGRYYSTEITIGSDNAE